MADPDGAAVHDLLRGLGPDLHGRGGTYLLGCHDRRQDIARAGPRAALRVLGGPTCPQWRPRRDRFCRLLGPGLRHSTGGSSARDVLAARDFTGLRIILGYGVGFDLGL